MSDSFIIGELIKKLKNDQMSWSFYLAASVLKYKNEKTLLHDWHYTRVGFLFAWCIENCAFADNVNERYLAAKHEVFCNRIPVSILSSELIEFTPAALSSPFSEFLLNYYNPGWDFTYGVDFDKMKKKKKSSPDILIEPSWDNYLKLKKIINMRLDVWVNKSQ